MPNPAKKTKLDLYRPPYNFLGLNAAQSRFESAPVVILPIPFEATTSYRSGTKEGPRAIIDASRYLETYDDELDQELSSRIGIHTLPELDPDLDSIEKTIDRIELAAQDILAKNKFVVGLGGEHSVSLGLVRAYHKKYPKLTVVQFDAHADLRNQFEGTKYSHACVMRRIQDLGVPTIGIGIRSMSQPEAEYIRNNPDTVTIYPAKLSQQNQDKQTWITEIISHLQTPVYVTIDIDVFDPAFVPGTGTPEPGGMDWYEITQLLAELTKRVDIVGFDVVELSPLGGQVVSEFLTAKLVYKFLNYLFANKLNPIKKNK
jgi:agmatinase